MKIFIIGAEDLGKKYGMLVKFPDNVLLIREIHDRYDFAAGILALYPDTAEEALYIKIFDKKYPKLAKKLTEFRQQ